ncbi:MAG TPA: Na+/H+ antiporter NhaC family protein [Spirochaetia bacterium]
MSTKPAAGGSAIQISARAFITTIAIILGLMVASGVLTYVIPSGAYHHVVEAGVDRVVPGTFQHTARPDYPAWRWFTAPVEVLWSPGNLQVITIIVLLVLIGGSFTVLDKSGILKVALSMIVARFKRNKFLLMAAIILFFMLASSVLGIYEEAAPLVVFIVPLALYLGWDSLTGLGMSLLALGFGFAAATMDPFMVTIAQSLAGLPLYSGLWFRAIFFVTMFALVFLFVRRHARKVEADPTRSLVYEEDRRLRATIDVTGAVANEADASKPRMRAGVRWLGIWFLAAIVFILAATRIRAISTFAFPVMGLFFAIACNGAALVAGEKGKTLGTCFLQGMKAIVPAIVMILMAMSVKLIITNGGILDTILNAAATRIGGVGPYVAVLFVYLITLVFEFFIPSASAKAFLIIPILAPLADLVGLTRQTVVFAFDNGDGFANILYPTNPFLMICLGLTVVSWPKWARWTLPLQAVTVLVCFAFMAFAVAIRFGPF